MKVNFMPISDKQIENYLKQNNLSENITKAMIQSCNGSIGKALKIEEEKEKYIQIEELVQNMKKQDITEIWKGAQVLYDAKENIIPLLEYMIIIFYELLKKEDKICYANGIQIIEQTKQRILANSNYDMSIDNMPHML